MFLLYRNQGERFFGAQPLVPHPRNAWAFQFCIEGSYVMTIREQGKVREERITAPALTVSGPDFEHGFTGKSPDEFSRIIAFHFDEADYLLRFIVGQTGYRVISIAESEIDYIQELYQRCAEVRDVPGFIIKERRRTLGILSSLIYSIVSLELNLFFLRHISRVELGSSPDFGERKVSEALAWFEANLGSRPNIQHVAQAVHISSTHLRRLFHKFRGVSPQTAFAQVQFERAKWLMRDHSISLEDIAESVGFGSASAFSRSFKAEFGVPPRTYRDAMPKT